MITNDDIKKTYSIGERLYFFREPLSSTYHSRIRMAEYKINDSWVENLWQKSKQVELRPKVAAEKKAKYGEKVQKKFQYFKRCGYTLTVKIGKDNKPLLITITKVFSGNLMIK